MSLLSSELKTWRKRNGFSGEGCQTIRESNGYITRNGRHFRIRGDEVDISDMMSLC